MLPGHYTNPDEEEISSDSGTIPDGGEETWDYTTRDTMIGILDPKC